jgi:diamine N-acetyltransferase
MIAVGNIGFLRAPEPSDLNWLFELENDQSLWYLGHSKEPLSKDVLTQYIAQQPGNLFRDGQLRLILEHNAIPVGAVDLFDYDPIARRAGLGIAIDNEFRGRGWAIAALDSFEKYAFGTLGLHSLYAHVPLDNEASLALFEGSGFTGIGDLKDWVWKEGNFVDARLFQKIKL